ncbi:hypothetical protein TWF730_002324 [Orbilia blumenaviensis]|uniref:Peptidase S8/S53 domain-containing protein n=1 Tax=Orbilia blumenaviensis TaxID=1796055 RepID=A0AAV9UDF2_9PEZI
MLKIYDHIKSNSMGRPCIVNIAAEFYRKEGDDIAEVVKKLHGLENVIVVTMAGDGAPGDKISHSPASLGAKKDLKRLVVVGGADNEFKNLLQYDESFLNMVWAPIDNIFAPQFPDPRLREDQLRSYMYYEEHYSGTSSATAFVSGMLANYISRNPSSPTRVKDAVKELKALSYTRDPQDGQNVKLIWNGIASSEWPARPDARIKASVGSDKRLLIYRDREERLYVYEGSGSEDEEIYRQEVVARLEDLDSEHQGPGSEQRDLPSEHQGPGSEQRDLPSVEYRNIVSEHEGLVSEYQDLITEYENAAPEGTSSEW